MSSFACAGAVKNSMSLILQFDSSLQALRQVRIFVPFAEELNYWSRIIRVSVKKKKTKETRAEAIGERFYATAQTYALSETSSVSPSEPEEVP